MLRTASWFFLLLVLLGGCKKPGPTQTAPSHAAEKRAPQLPKIEACSLITKEEVGAVQETTISDTKSSETSDGSHLVSQCYYAATGPNLSVSLALTQIDPKNPSATPRAYWEETFGSFKEDDAHGESRENKEHQARGGEEEEKKLPPKKVDGVGEEAFWVGDRVGGALYVLKGDVFIRISVGGADTEQVKLEKSKMLAQNALSRL